jgi:hypothetical protein
MLEAGHRTMRVCDAMRCDAMVERPIYTLHIRPEPGVDAARALRAGLKALAAPACAVRIQSSDRPGRRGALVVEVDQERERVRIRPSLPGD